MKTTYHVLDENIEGYAKRRKQNNIIDGSFKKDFIDSVNSELVKESISIEQAIKILKKINNKLVNKSKDLTIVDIQHAVRWVLLYKEKFIDKDCHDKNPELEGEQKDQFYELVRLTLKKSTKCKFKINSTAKNLQIQLNSVGNTLQNLGVLCELYSKFKSEKEFQSKKKLSIFSINNLQSLLEYMEILINEFNGLRTSDLELNGDGKVILEDLIPIAITGACKIAPHAKGKIESSFRINNLLKILTFHRNITADSIKTTCRVMSEFAMENNELPSNTIDGESILSLMITIRNLYSYKLCSYENCSDVLYYIGKLSYRNQLNKNKIEADTINDFLTTLIPIPKDVDPVNVAKALEGLSYLICYLSPPMTGQINVSAINALLEIDTTNLDVVSMIENAISLIMKSIQEGKVSLDGTINKKIKTDEKDFTEDNLQNENLQKEKVISFMENEKPFDENIEVTLEENINVKRHIEIECTNVSPNQRSPSNDLKVADNIIRTMITTDPDQHNNDDKINNETEINDRVDLDQYNNDETNDITDKDDPDQYSNDETNADDKVFDKILDDHYQRSDSLLLEEQNPDHLRVDDQINILEANNEVELPEIKPIYENSLSKEDVLIFTSVQILNNPEKCLNEIKAEPSIHQKIKAKAPTKSWNLQELINKTENLEDSNENSSNEQPETTQTQKRKTTKSPNDSEKIEQAQQEANASKKDQINNKQQSAESEEHPLTRKMFFEANQDKFLAFPGWVENSINQQIHYSNALSYPFGNVARFDAKDSSLSNKYGVRFFDLIQINEYYFAVTESVMNYAKLFLQSFWTQANLDLLHQLHRIKVEDLDQQYRYPQCISFFHCKIKNQNICYISASHGDEKILKMMDTHAKEMNNNNDVIFIVITQQGLTFPTLLRKTCKKLNIKFSNKGCAEKFFLAVLMKLLIENPDLFVVGSVNCFGVPYNRNKLYGKRAEKKSNESYYTPINADKSDVIDMDQPGYIIPMIPCCFECQHMKPAVFALLQAAYDYGMQQKRSELTVPALSPIRNVV